MSTSLSQAHLATAWKQEVNQRIAAHKSRKGAGGAEPKGVVEANHSASRRASEAAARVAARFAKAPSYDEVLANEARAALRAAEAASKAALEAQAAAASILAGIEAAVGTEPAAEWQGRLSAIAETEEENQLEGVFSDLPSLGHGEGTPALACARTLDLPEGPAEPAFVPAAQAPHLSGAPPEELWSQDWLAVPEAGDTEIAVVEPSQPILGNLIEFPRELVAARKARPRRAEGPYAAPEVGTQLSIFEVDPETISTQPAIETGVPDEAASAVWTVPEWSAIELEAQPPDEVGELLDEPAAEPAPPPAIEPARLSLRLMAGVVDGSLILATVLAAAVAAVSHAKTLPNMHEAAICLALGLLVAGGAYEAVSLTLGSSTPGMKYAQISLCTFDGQIPTRAQRRRRLAALLLSVLPVGFGFGWILFDDNHLTWHDRLSGTYPRKN